VTSDPPSRLSHDPSRPVGLVLSGGGARGAFQVGVWEVLRNDPLGIPHVRYCVRFERQTSEHSETNLRMLALGAFRSVYRERLV